MMAIEWDASDYSKNSQGQFAWALSLIERLGLDAANRVLDIGCGDGKVSVELARRVPAGRVVGIDSSPAMIDLAQRTWSNVPNVEFHLVDAQTLPFEGNFDIAFSNSTLHWIPDHRPILDGVARALEPGGRLFFSMGGRGTASVVYSALAELEQIDQWARYLMGVPAPHHFFGPEEYHEWLPLAGLTPQRVELVPKPMHHRNLQALEGWLRTTWVPYTDRIPREQRADFIGEMARRVRPACQVGDGGAILMPMVNLEVQAEKPGRGTI